MKSKKPSSRKKKPVVSVNLDELKQLVTAAVIAAKDTPFQPYIDPKAKANEDALRLAMRKQKAIMDASRKESQDRCPHYKGCNEISVSGLKQDASIVWHGLDRGGAIIGICTNCTRIFKPSDADYDFWRTRRTSNTMSAGGQIVLNALPTDNPLGEYFYQTNNSSTQEGSEPLDNLSDSEITDLYEGAVALYKELKPVLDTEKLFKRV